MGNCYVYCVISQRAGGLSIGINMNPDRRCNFDCAYCEVDRSERGNETPVVLPVMAEELARMLDLEARGGFSKLPGYDHVPGELLRLAEVALSGDGEPTLSRNFEEIVECVVHLRAKRENPFFKIVLITNGSGLHRRAVRKGIALLLPTDEIWVKLDVGTQAHMDRVNRADVPLQQILENIVRIGKERPIVIQSLFPLLAGAGPTEEEISAYVDRLRELRCSGAEVKLVQIYSAHRPPMRTDCGHLSLPALSEIARRVRTDADMVAEVF